MLTSNVQLDAKMLRQKSGLKLREVAEKVGVNLKTVHRWETGESPPMIPLEKVVILTEIFDCSIKDLADAYALARDEWLKQQKQGSNQS